MSKETVKRPAEIRYDLIKLAEMAFDLLEQLTIEVPVGQRLADWRWNAVMTLRAQGVKILQEWQNRWLVASGLDEEDCEAIWRINDALGNLGIPCASPSVEEAENWVTQFGEYIEAW